LLNNIIPFLSPDPCYRVRPDHKHP
jgi:hypothetical protein